MFGWLSLAADSASRMKRCTLARLPVNSGRSTFTAMRRDSFRSVAANTCANPPSPSSCSTRKFGPSAVWSFFARSFCSSSCVASEESASTVGASGFGVPQEGQKA